MSDSPFRKRAEDEGEPNADTFGDRMVDKLAELEAENGPLEVVTEPPTKAIVGDEDQTGERRQQPDDEEDPQVVALLAEQASLKAEHGLLLVANHFLNSTDFDWQDKGIALAELGDLSQFVDDDGTVDKRALGVAIRRLAREKPYLVCEQVVPAPPPMGPSGAPVGTGRRRLLGGPRLGDEALKRKYPALDK